MPKISKETVDTLEATRRPDGSLADGYLWDAELKGFGCKATPAGRKVFIVQYRIGGRSGKAQRVTLGRLGELTPAEARTRAKAVLGRIAEKQDPAAEERERKRKLAGETFRDVAERFLTMNSKPGRYWQQTRKLVEQNTFPALASKPFATVVRSDIVAVLDETGSRSQATARLLFAALRPIFPWAVDRGMIEHNPIAGLKGPKPLPSRERVLSIDEIKVFWVAAGELGWPFGPFFRLLLLTGQRREEVAGMRRAELDIDAGVWCLPSAQDFLPQRTKNGQEHRVDLAPQALRILVPLLASERQGLIFSTTGKTTISGFSKAKARLDQIMAAKLSNPLRPWRVHDLRRSMATHMGEQLGIDQGVVERILNHVSGTRGGLMGIYQRQEYREKRRQALMAWGSFVERLTGDQPATGNILALESGAGA
jgi:integrase